MSSIRDWHPEYIAPATDQARLIEARLRELGSNWFTLARDVGVSIRTEDTMHITDDMVEQNTGCDHAFVRDGEVKRPLGNGSYQTWNKYVCSKCLQPRFALVYEWNQYLLMGGACDGSRIVDSLEALP